MDLLNGFFVNVCFHIFLVRSIDLKAYGLDELGSILPCCLVSVRVGLKGTGIDDSLVVHQLVTLVVGKEIVGFGVTHDAICFDDLGLARFLLRLLDFVEHVLTHDVIIQLGFSLAVEPEAPYFAFDFALLGFVAIILGTTRYEFFDVIVSLQFAGKLSEVISQGRVGLSRFLQVMTESVS